MSGLFSGIDGWGKENRFTHMLSVTHSLVLLFLTSTPFCFARIVVQTSFCLSFFLAAS